MIHHTKTAVGLISYQGHVLLFQRPKNERTYGLWCFPGGTVEEHESPCQALDRELFEEAGIQVEKKQLLLQLRKNQSERTQDLYVYYISDYSFELANPENHVWTWARKESLTDYPSFKINLIVSEYLSSYPMGETNHPPGPSYLKDTIVTCDGL